MKPKILLVKHFDHAIIALLAILLLIALFLAFGSKEKQIGELAGEIERYDRTIVGKMNRDEPLPAGETEDYFDDLVGRLKHLPVISPYPAVHNPFYRRGQTRVTQVPLVLPEGQAKEYTLPRTRITDVLQSDDAFLRVEFEYVETDDGEDRFTRVLLTAEYLDEERDVKDVEILLGDDAGRVYSWDVIVQRSKRSAPPNPPISVGIQVRGPYEVVGQPSKPARVLITCSDDDPTITTSAVGVTAGVNIYRKRPDTPDIDYVRLNTQPILPLGSEADLQRVKADFYNPDELLAGGAAETGRASGGAGSPIVPREAGTTRPGLGRAGARASSPTQGSASLQIGKTYAFVDNTVDGGESYIYKIETLSAAEEAEPVPCELPYVTPSAIAVPSLINFYVGRITTTGARCVVSRTDPDTGQPRAEEFDVAPGMRIGAMITIQRTEAEIYRDPGPVERQIDFTTENVVVDTLRTRPIIVYTVSLDRKTGYFNYKIKMDREAELLYLTPRGSLSVKQRSETGGAGTGTRPGLGGLGGGGSRPGGGPGRMPGR